MQDQIDTRELFPEIIREKPQINRGDRTSCSTDDRELKWQTIRFSILYLNETHSQRVRIPIFSSIPARKHKQNANLPMQTVIALSFICVSSTKAIVTRLCVCVCVCKKSEFKNHSNREIY